MAREKVKWCENCAMLANSEEGNRWLEAQIRDLEAKLARVVEVCREHEAHELPGVRNIGDCAVSLANAIIAAAKGE